VLRSQGDTAGALTAYQAGLAIRERLSERDPGNTGWQRDLSVSCWKIGEMMEAEESEEANAWWRRAHDKLAELKAEGRLAPMDEQYLAWLRQKIGR